MFKAKYVSIIFVILWMAVIFYLSAQPSKESNGLSKAISKSIAKVTDPDAESKLTDKQLSRRYSLFNSDTRNYAHIAVFMILSMVAVCAFLRLRMRPTIAYPVAFLFCIAYAGLDELHQKFVPGRGAQWQDFRRDTVGIAIGLAVYLVVSLGIGICRRLQNRY